MVSQLAGSDEYIYIYYIDLFYLSRMVEHGRSARLCIARGLMFVELLRGLFAHKHTITTTTSVIGGNYKAKHERGHTQ